MISSILLDCGMIYIPHLDLTKLFMIVNVHKKI